MAEGLRFGRAFYRGKSEIGSRDESFAERADAVSEKNGWLLDIAQEALQYGRALQSGAPVTSNRAYFWPLKLLDRDYVLTEGRMAVNSTGTESQTVAIYIYEDRKLTQVVGSEITFDAGTTGVNKVQLPTEVTLRAETRYYVGGVSTAGTGDFVMWRAGDPAVEISYIDAGGSLPENVELIGLSKTRPERVPYAVYLSKEASLVL